MSRGGGKASLGRNWVFAGDLHLGTNQFFLYVLNRAEILLGIRFAVVRHDFVLEAPGHGGLPNLR
jgi:hypothetical protein